MPCWTRYTNTFLEQGKLPDKWREALILIAIPKALDGGTRTPDYRGTALKNCKYNFFTSIIPGYDSILHGSHRALSRNNSAS